MANRLAFQTQLASIMEVLANAAVAEICKLVDDDYAVVSLQMSQCQRENKALKRKLHLLELKMARGYAERRLRESAQNNNRPRVQINANDRHRGSSSSTDGVFQRQMDMGLWPGGVATGEATSEPVHSDTTRDKSPDVELVEPQPRLVKEEKMEEGIPQDEEIEDDVPLIGEDGVVECGSRGGGGLRPSLQQQDTQSASCQTQASAHLPQPQPQPQANRTRHPGSGSSTSSSNNNNRGVEVSGSSPLLKSELSASLEDRDSLLCTPPPLEQQETTDCRQHIDDGGDDSQFDAFCDNEKSSNSFGEFFDEALGRDAEERMPSCSYSMAAADFPSTSSGINGWTCGGISDSSGFPSTQPVGDHSKVLHRTSSKERLFVCNYCGKAFNRPKKVEIHQRIHTGERPFRCSTCGKMFSEAGNLKKHQRVHTGEKPYCCELCGKGFAWIRNLKMHQQKSHPDVYVEEETWAQN